MNDTALFIGIAERHGFSPQAARATFDNVTQRLHVRRFQTAGLHPTTFKLSSFYIFRSGGGSGGGSGETGGRQRLLLAFPSADAALSFAQRNGLGPAPRLVRMTVAQLLATLMQRPVISALIFADEFTDMPHERALPPGLRLERSALLDLLKGE